MKSSKDDIVFETFAVLVVTILSIMMLYPFLNAMALSLNDANDTLAGGISIWPRVPTLLNYEVVFQNPRIGNAYLITIARTLFGSFVSIIFTALMAYGLSKEHLRGRKFYMGLCVVTMYFSGGLIPTYILMKALGLTNNFFVYILPAIVNVWNMIIFKSFFEGIPKSLEESAQMDGANHYQIFFSIIIHVSLPVFASLILFTAVGHWNDWFAGAIFMAGREGDKLVPMQTLLNQIINSNIMMEQLGAIAPSAAEMARMSAKVSTKSLTMATMMVATLPIVMVYPFLQKYFAKGVMIGSIKE